MARRCVVAANVLRLGARGVHLRKARTEVVDKDSSVMSHEFYDADRLAQNYLV